jgi:hypothetical protein
MCMAVGIVACLLVLLGLLQSPRSAWRPLAPLTGDGAIGSPGGTHPFAVDGDTVHFAWAHGGNIHYRRSHDAGRTWTNPLPITDGGTSEYPVSLELGQGVLHLIWPDRQNGGWEVYHQRSLDGGDTWGPESRLTPDIDLFRMGTAISGSTLHVTWASRSSVEPTPAGTHTWGEIYHKRSTDGGLTWGPTTRLTEPDASAMRPGVAAYGEYVHLIWFDRRDATNLLDWRIYYRRSTDGGATWEPEVELHAAPDAFPHHPQIVATPGGRVCAIWEQGQTFDGERWSGDPGLHSRVSDDSGLTWSRARRITSVNAPNGWATHAKTHACASRVHLAWTDAPDGQGAPRAGYYMTSPDGGATWGAPERLTPASAGNCGVEGVGGGEAYAVVSISQSGRLYCCSAERP